MFMSANAFSVLRINGAIRTDFNRVNGAIRTDFNRVKGRRRLGKERALIERIQKNWGSMNLFVHEMNIPFDNNQAERDVRNVKTKIKVSGCFRSIQGAEDYLDIMSYLSTAAKHGIDAVRALKAAFRGESHIVLSRTL